MICRGKGEFCHEGRCREVAPYADPVRTAAVPYSEGLKIKGGAHADTVSDGGAVRLRLSDLSTTIHGKI